MTKNPKIFIPALAVLAVLFVVLVSTLRGSGVPDGAVAKVSDTVIEKSDFDSYMKLAFGSQALGPGEVVVPDPPNFTKCIANKKKAAPKNSKNAELKKQCETEFKNAKEQVMTALIQSEWFRLEADDRGIKVTDKELDERFRPLREQTFQSDKQYLEFLKKTGQTEKDLKNLVKNQIIQEKLRAEEVKANQTISDKEIAKYFADHKKEFSQPASRDLRVVFNSSKSKAEAAKKELDGGTSWKDVVKKYSEDPASKNNEGRYPKVPQGQFEENLDKAIQSAKVGNIAGPVKTQFGYYVFTVEQTNPASQQKLTAVKDQIRQTLQAEKQQKAFDDFRKKFEAKWRDKTKCADDFKIALCKNGEKKKKEEAPKPGQQQPQQPQQAPAQ